MGKKLFIVVTLLFGTLLFAQFTEGEADFKLLDGKAPALTLKGWSLNKVKLVPSAAVEEAVLSVTRTEEGDDILSLKAEPHPVMIWVNPNRGVEDSDPLLNISAADSQKG